MTNADEKGQYKRRKSERRGDDRRQNRETPAWVEKSGDRRKGERRNGDRRK